MTKPLILSVVGHTNVGKTSLLRTLTRNIYFGEVADRPSTTKHVEGARLVVEGDTLVELYDTPGLEDAISLLEYLESLTRPNEQSDGATRLTRFLDGPEATGHFAQEAKVIQQLLNSDAGLYVIDVREPILAKYKDELHILRDSGKPLLPIFNFVASDDNLEQDWKTTLSHLGLHAIVRFDTIAPALDGERRLYESLALLIATARPTLERLINELEQQRHLRRQSAILLIAETLIDTAAYRRLIDHEQSKDDMTTSLHADIRQLEQKTIEKLLKLYKFTLADAKAANLPLFDGRFADDLFSTEALKQMGSRLTKGFATGAVTGASIDLAVGGLSLGAAAVIGAMVGGVSQTVKHYGPQLIGRFKGGYKLSVDDAILRLLIVRLLALQQQLDARGHAAQESLYLANPSHENWKTGKLSTALTAARAHPEWSSLNPKPKLHNSQRNIEITKLAKQLSD